MTVTRHEGQENNMPLIKALTMTRHEDQENNLPLIKAFNDNAETAPYSVSVVKFQATRVDHIGDRRVAPSGRRGATSKLMLATLESNLHVAAEEKPVNFEILVIPIKKSTLSDLDSLERAVKFLASVEHDALEFFFSQNEQTMEQKRT